MTIAIVLYVLIAGRAEIQCEGTNDWKGAIVGYLLGWLMIPARILAKLAS